MTDLEFDSDVRRHLARVVDAAPLAPPLSRIATVHQSPTGRPRRPSRRASLLVAIATVGGVALGTAVVTTEGRDRDNSQEIATEPDGSAPTFGAARELMPPSTANLAGAPRYLATVGSDLLVGSTVSVGDGLAVDVSAFAGANPPSSRLLFNDPSNVVLGAMASTDHNVILAASYRDAEPVAVLSFDVGETWREERLPGGAGSESYFAGAAVGDSQLLVAGPSDLWIADARPGSRWRPVEIPGLGRLRALSWDGSQFLLAARPEPPDAPSEIALWRSADGLTWSGPEAAYTDPGGPASGQMATLTSSLDGRSALVTPVADPSGERTGTAVTVLDHGVPGATMVMTGWTFRGVTVTSWGYLTAAEPLSGSGEPRLLASSDGRAWTDAGPAPGSMVQGVEWLGGVVYSGYAGPRPASDPEQMITWFIPLTEGPPPGLPVPLGAASTTTGP